MSGAAAIEARKAAVLRATTLEAVVRRRVPKLRGKGREMEALCPFHSENTPSFTVVPDKGFFHCFGCGAHGSAFDFVMQHDGLDFMGALAALEAECGLSGDAPSAPGGGRPVQRAARPRQESDFVDSAEAGQAVWFASVSARGTLVETYLRSRGIDPAASGILSVLGFHPRCPTGLWRKGRGPDDARSFAPAMLAPIRRVVGAPGQRRLMMQGVHITYLAPDGSGKAVIPARNGRIPPSRKIWGELAGGAVPIPPVGVGRSGWLEDQPGTELVVGEGLESTLSLMALRGPCCRGGFATLSLNNLQGFPLSVKVRREWAWPLWQMRPDPARRMFTFDKPGRVVVGVDADMKGFPARAVQETPRGPVVKRAISGRERSDICAELACAAWRDAGASGVIAMRRAMGRDFND